MNSLSGIISIELLHKIKLVVFPSYWFISKTKYHYSSRITQCYLRPVGKRKNNHMNISFNIEDILSIHYYTNMMINIEFVIRDTISFWTVHVYFFLNRYTRCKGLILCYIILFNKYGVFIWHTCVFSVNNVTQFNVKED